MLRRMLKGAISYARLSQKPSRAQPAAQVVPREGVARWLALRGSDWRVGCWVGEEGRGGGRVESEGRAVGR